MPWSLREDVGHQICIDPADYACIHITDLEQVVDLRVTGTTTAVDHLPYPPILVTLLSDLKVVLDDDRHPWSDIQKDRAI